jgi:hypothetical protein
MKSTQVGVVFCQTRALAVVLTVARGGIGVCEGLTYDEVKEQHPEIFIKRKEDKLRFRYVAASQARHRGQDEPLLTMRPCTGILRARATRT